MVNKELQFNRDLIRKLIKMQERAGGKNNAEFTVERRTTGKTREVTKSTLQDHVKRRWYMGMNVTLLENIQKILLGEHEETVTEKEFGVFVNCYPREKYQKRVKLDQISFGDGSMTSDTPKMEDVSHEPTALLAFTAWSMVEAGQFASNIKSVLKSL